MERPDEPGRKESSLRPENETRPLIKAGSSTVGDRPLCFSKSFFMNFLSHIFHGLNRSSLFHP
jgi:hypothetical protein